MPKRLLVALLAASIGVLGSSGALTLRASELAPLAPLATQAKSVGQKLERSALVDGDYLFRLMPPSSDWSVLDEQDAARFHASAIAGLRSTDGIVAAVLVYRTRKPKLDELKTWLVDWAPIDDRTVLSRGAGRVAGQDTFEVVGFGDVDRSRVRFRLQAFVWKGCLYLLFAQAPFAAASAPGTEFQPFFDAFALLPGTPLPRPFASAGRDELEAGWSLRDGVYCDPLLGLEIAVPSGWRVAVPASARYAKRRVSFVSRDPQAVVVLTSELVDPTLDKPWREDASHTSAFAIDWTPPAGLKPTKLQLAGAELPTQWSSAYNDPLHYYLRGCGVAGATGYRIDVQVLRGEEAKSIDALKRLLAAARALAPDERAERALAAHRRETFATSTVGPTGFLRGGRYKDYAAQFTIDPPGGFFETFVVPTEDQRESALRLLTRDPSRDVTGLLYSAEVRGSRVSVRDDCESLLASICGPEPDGIPTPQRGANIVEAAIAAGPYALFTMSAAFESRRMPYRALVAATDRGKRRVVAAWYGPAPAMTAAEPSLRASIATFRWLLEKHEPRRIAAGRFVDEQLDIVFELAGESWKLADAHKRGAFDAYACELVGPGTRICLLEMRASLAVPTAAAFATQLQRRFGADFGGLDWNAPTEFEATVRDHPAHVWRFDGPSGRIEVDVVIAHGLIYGIAFVRAGASDAGPDEFLALKRRLSFGSDEPLVPPVAAAASSAASQPAAAAPAADEGEDDDENERVDPASAAEAAQADSISARDDAPKRVQPAPGVLALPSDWRAFPLRDAYPGLDFAAPLRARPDWLAVLVRDGHVRARGADAAPQLAFVRRPEARHELADTLAVERFAFGGSAADPAAVASAISAAANAAGATETATRALEAGRLGAIAVVSWREPAAETAAAKSKPGAKPTRSEPTARATPQRHATVYVLADGEARGWAIVLRAVDAPDAAALAALERAISDFAPLP